METVKLTTLENKVVWCLQNGWDIITSSDVTGAWISTSEKGYEDYHINNGTFNGLLAKNMITQQLSYPFDYVLTSKGKVARTKQPSFEKKVKKPAVKKSVQVRAQVSVQVPKEEPKPEPVVEAPKYDSWFEKRRIIKSSGAGGRSTQIIGEPPFTGWKLLFIDNDGEGSTMRDVKDLQRTLNWHAGIAPAHLKDIQTISHLHRLSKGEMLDLLFDPNHVICTWSMYTANHYGSLYQLREFLSICARAEVADRIYFDSSGELIRTLERDLKEWKEMLAIMQAIETNYILSYSSGDIVRIRIELKGYYESMIRVEPFDLAAHLGFEKEKE